MKGDQAHLCPSVEKFNYFVSLLMEIFELNGTRRKQ